MGRPDVVITESTDAGHRVSRLAHLQGLAGELHHGGTPGAPGAPVWVRGPDGRRWEVEAGSPEHTHLLESGGVEVDGSGEVA